jgi:RIO kinase 1
MKVPEGLATLLDYGVIQQVIRPLMSGKEAQVYVVVAGGEECVAKVYKESDQRTFRHRSDYTEGRRTRNTRDQRAMAKRTRHGRKQDEAAWRSTEVDMIHRLRDAGVRVPEPINFVDGVLVMELVKDAAGSAAPRLGDLEFSAAEAKEIYHELLGETIKMLCAGVIHGDLSEFNVLMGAEGPVVIDFPQAVDPTQNRNAEKLLLRDVGNLHRFLARFAPSEPHRRYGEEIWALYQANRLHPKTSLTGRHEAPKGRVDTSEVTALIQDADREARRRLDPGDFESDDFEAAGAPLSEEGTETPRRRVVDFTQQTRRGRGRGQARGAAAAPREGAARDNGMAAKIPSGPAATRSGAERAIPSGPKADRGRPRGEAPEASRDGDRRGRGAKRPPAEPRGRGRDEASRPATGRAGDERDPKRGETEESARRRRPRRRRGRRAGGEAGGSGAARPKQDEAGGGRSASTSDRAQGPARPARGEGDRRPSSGSGSSDRPSGRRPRRRRKTRPPE